MKAIKLVAALSAMFVAGSALASGDPVAGQGKAGACIACHGSKDFPGLFPLVQLAGRDADKLATNTNKYRTFKLISPMMNMVVLGLSDQDVEDISAYYQGLSKPALMMQGIRGDEDLAPN
jgi:cytochrome c553